MLEIINVQVEELENAGCNNGNYPEYSVKTSDGQIFHGITCRCGSGCSCTDRLPSVGMVFQSDEEFEEFRRVS